jgi:UDP-glucose 4-epimerase
MIVVSEAYAKQDYSKENGEEAMELVGKRILVTGGAGFIGSHLVDMLAPHNDVTVVDNLSTGSKENIRRHLEHKAIQFIEADIRDKERMYELTKNIDIIYHLAVQCVRVSLYDPTLVHEVNATGTLNLCQAATKNGVQKFVFTSSAEVYGEGKFIPIDENHPLESHTPYGAAKLAGEAYVGVYRRTYGLPSVILRLFNTYGQREHFEGAYGEVIPRFVVRVINGLSPVLFGDGEQTRSFCNVTDTVRAIIEASRREAAVGQIINIGSDKEITINKLAETIIKLLGNGQKMMPLHWAPRPGEIRRHTADISKARQLLGFKLRVNLIEGLNNYINWVRGEKKDVSQLLKQVTVGWEAR